MQTVPQNTKEVTGSDVIHYITLYSKNKLKNTYAYVNVYAFLM